MHFGPPPPFPHGPHGGPFGHHHGPHEHGHKGFWQKD